MLNYVIFSCIFKHNKNTRGNVAKDSPVSDWGLWAAGPVRKLGVNTPMNVVVLNFYLKKVFNKIVQPHILIIGYDIYIFKRSKKITQVYIQFIRTQGFDFCMCCIEVFYCIKLISQDNPIQQYSIFK